MARIIQARDALKEKIDTLWPVETRESQTDDEVLTPWAFRIEAEKVVGRKVFVFPSAYTNELATRVSDRDDYTFVILVVERYREQGDPPDEWTDERVEFCEWLLNTVGDARGQRLLATNHLDGLWPETSEVTTVFDLEELTERKLFMSVLTITYREGG